MSKTYHVAFTRAEIEEMIAAISSFLESDMHVDSGGLPPAELIAAWEKARPNFVAFQAQLQNGCSPEEAEEMIELHDMHAAILRKLSDLLAAQGQGVAS